jgi:hypothetical protein
MIDTRVFINEPLDFQGICKVYAPTVRDVIVNKNYSVYTQLLTRSQEELEDEYMKDGQSDIKVPTPLEFLLACAYQQENLKHLVEDAFSFFIREPVSLLIDVKTIVIGDLESELKKVKSVNELRLITENNFFDFQNLVRQAIGEKPVEPPNPNEHPKVKAMKAKARYRDKIKAKRQANGEGIPFTVSLAALCCMGIGITPLNIGEISYASVHFLLAMAQNKDKYETDIRSLQAGAKTKDVKPKYWIIDPDT